MNSTFFGNVARDYGGAIAAWGEGSVDIENCTFYSNEALGVSSDRRAGSGGAVYASPGTFVTVRMNKDIPGLSWCLFSLKRCQLLVSGTK